MQLNSLSPTIAGKKNGLDKPLLADRSYIAKKRENRNLANTGETHVYVDLGK